MKIALIQMDIVNDKEKNLKKAIQNIKKASKKGADLVVLPEMFICPYNNEMFIKYAETEKGKVVSKLSEISKKEQIYLVAGSIPEKEDNKIYNTAFIFDKTGKIIKKHRKIHLFDIDIPGKITYKESDVLSFGKNITVFETEFCKVGVAICYDMRFPELIRNMTLKGAKLVVIPAAFNMTTGPAHWHTIAKSRSLDNQIYFAMCSPARNLKNDYIAYGHSLVANPWGKIQDSLDEKENILFSNIDFEYLDKIRAKLPLLKHRQDNIYKKG